MAKYLILDDCNFPYVLHWLTEAIEILQHIFYIVSSTITHKRASFVCLVTSTPSIWKGPTTATLNFARQFPNRLNNDFFKLLFPTTKLNHWKEAPFHNSTLWGRGLQHIVGNDLMSLEVFFSDTLLCILFW